VLSFCGRRGAIGARSDKLNDLDVRTDPGIVAPSRQQTGWLEYIDPPVNDFGLLAPIGPILRQFSVASRLVSRQFARGGFSEVAGERARFKQS